MQILSTVAESAKRLDIDAKPIRTWIKKQEQGALKASLGAQKLTEDQRIIRELNENSPLLEWSETY